MLLVLAVAGLVPWIVVQVLSGTLMPRIWLYAAGSGVFGGIYCLGLGLAYEREDFTVVYPVARALPVLALGMVDVLRLRPPTLGGWVGMSLVALGCFLAPLRVWGDLSLRRYMNRASAGMLLASLGTVGHSVIDKLAAEAIRSGPTPAAIYGYAMFVVIWATVAATLRFTNLAGRPARPLSWQVLLWAAAMCFGAYWMVLCAYQIAERVSYVVAFRQFSIVIGVVVAVTVIGEKARVIRVSAVLLITAGLVLIALQGS
jgi:drug/metabolite transporter (DMT)-like permease